MPGQKTLNQMLDSDSGLLSLMYDSIALAREDGVQEESLSEFEDSARTFCRFF